MLRTRVRRVKRLLFAFCSLLVLLVTWRAVGIYPHDEIHLDQKTAFSKEWSSFSISSDVGVSR